MQYLVYSLIFIILSENRDPCFSRFNRTSFVFACVFQTDSGRYSLLGDSTDNLRPSSQLRPNSYHDSAARSTYSSRWGSSSDSGAPDYKKLYEQEKLESERLRKELEQVKRDLTDSRSDADRLRKAQGTYSADTRVSTYSLLSLIHI